MHKPPGYERLEAIWRNREKGDDMDKIKDFLGSASWKTSTAGAAQILASGATIAKMLSTGAYDQNTLTLAIMGFITGFGLVFAKDKNVVGSPPTDKAV